MASASKATKTASFWQSPWFLAGVAAAVVVAQLTIFSVTDPDAGKPGSPAPSSAAAPAAAAPAPAPSAAPAPAPAAASAMKTPAPQKVATPVATSAPWDQQIEDCFKPNMSDEESVAALMQLYPQLPDQGKADVVYEVVDLIPDKDFGLLKPYLLDPKAPREVQETIFDDLFGRTESLEVSTMVEILKVPDHPFREEAIETLEDYLEVEHGEDVGKWETAANDWMQKNMHEIAEE